MKTTATQMEILKITQEIPEGKSAERATMGHGWVSEPSVSDSLRFADSGTIAWENGMIRYTLSGGSDGTARTREAIRFV